MTAVPSEIADPPGRSRPAARMSRSAWSWAVFEGGRDPFMILIPIYIFMPYFTSVMVGDAVRGQAMVADFSKLTGLAIALTAPWLGALVDRLGGRKPLLMLITAVTIPMLASLWWARPDGSGLSIGATLAIACSLNVLFAYSAVVHNALLVRAAGEHTSRASGLALMLANVGGVMSLAFVLWAFVLPGTIDLPMLPDAPLFGLDQRMHEPDRVVSWVSVAMLVAGAIPLLLFTRDVPSTGLRLTQAIRLAVSDFIAMALALRGQRNISLYLIARIFIADAIGAVGMFIGIYAAGVMSWGVLQMLLFAIWQSAWAGLGGFVGAGLDERHGPKLALQISLLGALACTAGIVGMAADRILYFWPYDPSQGGLGAEPFLITWPELVFLFFSGGVVFWATVTAGAGRTMLLAITPREQSGAFFGLYALAGTLTAWLGPLLVAFFTAQFASQQIGFAPVAALLLIGLMCVSLVKATRSVTPAR